MENKSFLLDEVKNNFYISGLMKRLWASQLTIIDEIDAICQKHNIKWFLDCGSLLGAVRHGGYIPWDDDFDICMLREDYDRFLSISREELPAKYIVMDYHSHDYWNQVLRISNTDTIVLEESHLKKFFDFPYPAGVDVFCLDYISDDNDAEKGRNEIAKILMDMVNALEDEPPYSQDSVETLAMLQEMLGISFDFNKNLKRQLFALGDDYYRMFVGTGAKRVALMNYWINYNNHSYPVKIFEKAVRVPFEDRMLPVPQGYLAKLKEDYGNYMNINKFGGIHDYPIYEHNENILKGFVNGVYPFEYTCHENITEPSDCDFSGKNKVLILVARQQHFIEIENIYNAFVKSGADVKVVVLPYYMRDALGNMKECIYEIDKFPEYALDYNDYNLSTEKPDIIITQCGHDNAEYTSTVSPSYYIDELKKHGKCVVYAVPFSFKELDYSDLKTAKSMKHFVMIPGVCKADYTVVNNENVKAAYISYLKDNTDIKDENIWNKKIISRQELISSLSSCDGNDKTIDQVEIGDRKKRLAVFISISTMICEEDKLKVKLNNICEILKASSDKLDVIWYMPEYERIHYSDAGMDKIGEEICSMAGNISVTDNFDEIINCDAYYGDPGVLVRKFIDQGKPVMLMDVSV